MQSTYPAAFEREMGCTAAEFAGWLPGASGGRPLTSTEGGAVVAIDDGRLTLAWRTLPPRRIALVTLPRLHVRFAFDGVTNDARLRFMRYFDLYTQRGGG